MKDALMKYETIDALQIDDLMARTEVRKPAGWDDNGSSSSNNSNSGGDASVKKEDSAKDKPSPDLSEPSGDTPAK
jgi:cell division protease FtsH